MKRKHYLRGDRFVRPDFNATLTQEEVLYADDYLKSFVRPKYQDRFKREFTAGFGAVDSYSLVTGSLFLSPSLIQDIFTEDYWEFILKFDHTDDISISSREYRHYHDQGLGMARPERLNRNLCIGHLWTADVYLGQHADLGANGWLCQADSFFNEPDSHCIFRGVFEP